MPAAHTPTTAPAASRRTAASTDDQQPSEAQWLGASTSTVTTVVLARGGSPVCVERASPNDDDCVIDTRTRGIGGSGA